MENKLLTTDLIKEERRFFSLVEDYLSCFWHDLDQATNNLRNVINQLKTNKEEENLDRIYKEESVYKAKTYEFDSTKDKVFDKINLESLNLKFKNKTLVFFDTETTWLSDDAQLIEVAYLTVKPWQQWFTLKEWLFNTDKEIELWALMVSWIIKEDIQDKPYFNDSDEWKELKAMSESDDYVFIAHNIAYDKRILANHGIFLKDENTLCTYRLATIIFPDLETFRQVWMKYQFPTILYTARISTSEVEEHRAWYDTYMLYLTFLYFFNHLLENNKFETKDLDEILEKTIKLSNSPILLKRFPTGKYKWEIISDVLVKDRKFLEKLYFTLKNNKKENDKDLIYTLAKYLWHDKWD